MRILPSKDREAFAWFQRRASINLAPPYQRHGGLWSKHTKGYLIDSMINGFDVPKLYVADLALLPSDLRDSRHALAVIDGRQRFETIFEWFKGSLRLNDDISVLDEPEVGIGGMTSKDLRRQHPELASRVEHFPLSVMTVIADSQDQINQLFIRLNQSQPLTGAETRNAMAGAAPVVLRRLAEHPFFDDRIRFSKKRGGDLNTAAKILLLEFTGGFVDVKKRRLDTFVQYIADVGVQAEADPKSLEEAEAAVRLVLDDMSKVFVSNDRLLSTQGQVPVYYWLIRTVGPTGDLREFLIHFERDRKQNRRLVTEVGTSGDIDVELLKYDQFNRSVNDQHSLQGRFEILRRRYEERESLAPQIENVDA